MKSLFIIALVLGSACFIGRFAIEGAAMIDAGVTQTEVALTEATR